MNNKTLYNTIALLSPVFFIGFGYSRLFNILGTNSYLAFIIGIIIGYLIIKLYEVKKEKIDFNNLKHPLLFKTIYITINTVILIQAIFTLQTFISSFYLIKSPTFFILLPVFILLFFIKDTNKENISLLSCSLLPINFIFLIITIIGIYNKINITNFLPFTMPNYSNLIEGIVLVIAYTVTPYMMLSNFDTSKKLGNKYILNSLHILVLGITIISVLGNNLIKLYRYPEYMILKNISIFNFISKVENIISISWVLILVYTSMISSFNVYNEIKRKKVFNIYLILIYFLSNIINYYYKYVAIVYKILPYIFMSFIITIIFYFFIETHHQD